MFESPLDKVLSDIHERFVSLDSGDVATYIPELGRADPSHFAISIATAQGHVYHVGDYAVPFTIQSISKPFAFGLALDDRGASAVLEKVGVEPSGDAFNAISLEPGTGRPRNPMINAGAITVSSLVGAGTQEAGLERLTNMFGRYAGHALGIDEAVYASERETGHRNRAIGHLLRNAGILSGDVDAVLDLYFRQCSLLVTCDDLAVMAATLANSGSNPLTGDQAVKPENLGNVLSVMNTCGMYDFAGSWAHRVGLPAKSGVGGGIVAVLPGQLGIGVFSPRLDAFGNSVRGVAVCEALSSEFGLHLLRTLMSPASALRAVHSLAEIASKHQRSADEATLLAREGSAVKVLQLQGRIGFSGAEAIFHRAQAEGRGCTTLVFDFRRVEATEPSVARMFSLFVQESGRTGCRTVFACLPPGSPLRVAVEGDDAVPEGTCLFFASADQALQYCEDQLLALRQIGPGLEANGLSLHAHPLLRGLSRAEIDAFATVVQRQTFAAGDRILAQGDDSDTVYLIASGLASVNLPLPGGGVHRVATLGAGSTFGEMALIDREPRAADVYSDTTLTCYTFEAGKLGQLANGEALRLKLFQALAQDLARRLRRANDEISALAS